MRPRCSLALKLQGTSATYSDYLTGMRRSSTVPSFRSGPDERTCSALPSQATRNAVPQASSRRTSGERSPADAISPTVGHSPGWSRCQADKASARGAARARVEGSLRAKLGRASRERVPPTTAKKPSTASSSVVETPRRDVPFIRRPFCNDCAAVENPTSGHFAGNSWFRHRISDCQTDEPLFGEERSFAKLSRAGSCPSIVGRRTFPRFRWRFQAVRCSRRGEHRSDQWLLTTLRRNGGLHVVWPLHGGFGIVRSRNMRTTLLVCLLLSACSGVQVKQRPDGTYAVECSNRKACLDRAERICEREG